MHFDELWTGSDWNARQIGHRTYRILISKVIIWAVN